MFDKRHPTILPSATLPPIPERQAKGRARLCGDERGASSIEYALIAAGIGAALAATVYSLGTTTKDLYSSLAALF